MLHIFQDNTNSFWFGSSDEGVYYYNGKHIIHYTTKDGLCDNRVLSIQQDNFGTVYVNTMGGISKFDGKRFVKLTPISNAKAQWKLQANDLWFKGAQDSGVVYRYDGKALHRLRFPKTKEGEDFIKAYPRSEFPAMAFNPYDVYTIYKDKRGVIWFGTGNLGLCRYNGKTFDWLYEHQLSSVEGGGSFGIRSILEDDKGDFWFCNTRYRYTILDSTDSKEHNLVRYKKEKGMLDVKTVHADDYVFYMSLVEDKKKRIWMATYSLGVLCYDPTKTPGKTMTLYTLKAKGKTVTLFSVYEDKQGFIWLGTHENGVYKLNGGMFERFVP